MEGIIWAKPLREKSDCEVKVTAKDGYTTFVFHNGAQHKITKRQKMNVGFTGTRVYFDDGNAFTVRKYGKGCKVVTRGERTQFCGEHKLTYDEERKLWCIGV